MIAVILQIENEADRDFMADLYERYRRLMLSEIYKLIHDPWVAEDLMQDTVVKLIDKVDLLKTMNIKRLSAYVVTAAKNGARDYLRKAARNTVDLFEDMEDTVPDEMELEDFVIRLDITRRMKEIWPKLPVDTQELLERKYILGQDNEEIAKVFGIRPASVRMKLTRARQLILHYYNDYQSELQPMK